MIEPKAPNLYIVRIRSTYNPGQDETRKVYAFSAEDATFQVGREIKSCVPTRYVSYVGPFNPSCAHVGPERCLCGLMTQ